MTNKQKKAADAIPPDESSAMRRERNGGAPDGESPNKGALVFACSYGAARMRRDVLCRVFVE